MTELRPVPKINPQIIHILNTSTTSTNHLSLSGTFTTLRHLNAKDQKKLLESDVFRLSHDDWMATPGSVKWSEGQGAYYRNNINKIMHRSNFV